MNRLWHEAIDRIGLYMLHKNRSADSLYNRPVEAPALLNADTLDHYYEAPEPANIILHPRGEYNGHEIGDFSFDSPLPSGETRNDRCSGEYYYPLRPTGKTYVIFVHGWRMNGFERLKDMFLDPFTRMNLHMLFFSLPYHLKREPEGSSYGGELMVSADLERTVHAVRQAVYDLRALIRYVKAQGGRVILVGLSLGGLFTNLTAAVEEQIDMLISLFYANSITDSVWYTNPGQYIKKDLLKNGVTYEELRQYWVITEPSAYKPQLPKERMLLVSGQFDLYVPLEDSDRLWEAWGRPRRLVYSCGHAGIAFQKERIARDVLAFLAGHGIT